MVEKNDFILWRFSLETAMPLLIDAVDVEVECNADLWSHDRLTIAFPDEGARKRFDRQFPAQ